jgi:hypothetical protein
MKFKALDIKKKIENLLTKKNIPYKNITIDGPGGDFDTESVNVHFKTGSLYIAGGNSEGDQDNSEWIGKTIEIDTLEISDGQDSEEAFTHDVGDIVLGYHAIKHYFKKKVNVVRSLDSCI